MAIDWDAKVLAPSMAVFGDAATYYAPGALGQPGLTLPDAVFDEAYAVVLQDGDQQVSTLMPVLGVRAARFPSPPLQGGQVRVPGKGLYVIRDPQPDGHGHILLLLNLVEAA